MTKPRSLPARPSLESLRKQAKRLARAIAAGDADAIARARARLPDAELPLSQRDAQLVLAREYGYAGWQDLTAEVQRRLGEGLEWAASSAQRVIHDNDVERLKALVEAYPGLLFWRSREAEGGLLGIATSSFGDSFDPSREQSFTRPACAEALIDAGAAVAPSVLEGLIASRANSLLELFRRKGLLPPTLKFKAALGDLDGVRECLVAGNQDLAAINEAFMCACHLERETVAAFLLDRSIDLDAELGRQIDDGPGRAALVEYLIEERALAFIDAAPADPRQAFLMHRIVRAVHDADLATFVEGLQREPRLLGDACIGFQVGLVERAVLRDRAAFVNALLDLEPALTRRRPPPSSQAIEFAITYRKAHLIPVLTRIWPVPDDLPHAAGIGDLARVERWFDEFGKPALGDLSDHFPVNSPRTLANLQWNTPTPQHVLDTALAWSVLNGHFEIADFLLEHGADVNTRWGSHEPASILHELVFHEDYEAMQFLIDRGIDMTIVDYRWGGTAQGWAYHAAKNERMSRWLTDEERRREQDRR